MTASWNEKNMPAVFKDLKLYDHQIQTCRNLLAKKSLVLVAPTGSGKTICYQIPVLVAGIQALVISPLIAIMQDQVEKNRSLGISAAMLAGGISYEQSWRIIALWLAKALKVLFVSPEKLIADSNLFNVLQKHCPGLIVIDEAHCNATWGRSFRPVYGRIKAFLQRFETTPILAATATARPTVKGEIVETINRANTQIIQVPLKLSNISLQLLKCDNSEEKIEKIKGLLSAPQSCPCIIFCLTRKRCEMLANHLIESGFPCQSYHSGMSFDERSKASSNFISSEKSVLIATSAFEMGVDKKNIRQVIHFDIPSSIESYIQGVGRAGRDGQPANAVLIYDEKTLDIIDNLSHEGRCLENSFFAPASLLELMQYAKSTNCRVHFLNKLMFPEEVEPTRLCGKCDNCRRKLPVAIDLEWTVRKTEIKLALKKWRAAKAFELGLKQFLILTDQQIHDISSSSDIKEFELVLTALPRRSMVESLRREISEIVFATKRS